MIGRRLIGGRGLLLSLCVHPRRRLLLVGVRRDHRGLEFVVWLGLMLLSRLASWRDMIG